MAVKSGTPLVSVGDSVKRGTTLISGLIYYYSDDFTVTQTDKIKADGEIVMRTKGCTTIQFPWNITKS